MIEIRKESMWSGKVLIDDTTSTWVDGDSIRINGDKVVVEHINGRTYIHYPSPQSINRAVYPASLASGTLNSDNVTLTLPAYYHYRTDASHKQILELPMAARSEGSEPLTFMHLTGALYVTVTNGATEPLTLHSIIVSSNRYQLNGSRTVDFNSISTTGAVLSNNSNERSVTLLFDTGYTLAANASLKVMLPVWPVGGGGYNNLFTVKVKSCSASQDNFYLYSRTQPSGVDHVLERKQVGYAPVSITASGTGSPLDQVNGHYVVRTPLEFQLMTKAITAGSVLPNTAAIDIYEDLDMQGFSIDPINNRDFRGTLDGHNHTIDNLTINSITPGNAGSFCALFKSLLTKTLIRNLTLNNITLRHQRLTNNQLYIAAFAAEYENNQNQTADTLTFENCTANISSIIIENARGAIYFGGLLANCSGRYAHQKIINCQVNIPNTSNQTISGNTSVFWGGFIGYIGTSETIIKNSSCVDNIALAVTNYLYAGGLIGKKQENRFSIKNSSVTGEKHTQANTGYLGSLIGNYVTPGTIDTLGNTKSITFSFNNGAPFTPDAWNTIQN